MTVTCPEGHQSEATDYCDTCGSPIGAGPSGAGSAGSGQTGGGGSSTPGPVIPPAVEGSALDLDPSPAPTLTCPHCKAPNVADALFCEACGYDFTTGAAPLGSPPVVPAEGQQEGALDLDLNLGADEDDQDDWPDVEPDTGAGAESDDQADAAPEEDEADDDDEPADEGADAASAGEAGPREDADDGAAEEQVADAPEADAENQAEPEAEAEREAEPAAEPDPEPEPAVEPAAAPSPSPDQDVVAAHVRPRHAPPSRALSDTWVVEVWVDPDWYAVQQTDEACPSPGLPDIVVVRRNVALIGRPSGSLGVRPDVDAGGDSAVSRRHAQLTSDGSRWWIEDLGSSNGTYVGSVGEPLPTEAIRQRVEIDRDDRIYVGAWTRLVLRQATASEQAGQG